MYNTVHVKQIFACNEFKKLSSIPFIYDPQEKVNCERLNNFVFGLIQKAVLFL